MLFDSWLLLLSRMKSGWCGELFFDLWSLCVTPSFHIPWTFRKTLLFIWQYYDLIVFVISRISRSSFIIDKWATSFLFDSLFDRRYKCCLNHIIHCLRASLMQMKDIFCLNSVILVFWLTKMEHCLRCCMHQNRFGSRMWVHHMLHTHISVVSFKIHFSKSMMKRLLNACIIILMSF